MKIFTLSFILLLAGNEVEAFPPPGAEVHPPPQGGEELPPSIRKGLSKQKPSTGGTDLTLPPVGGGTDLTLPPVEKDLCEHLNCSQACYHGRCTCKIGYVLDKSDLKTCIAVCDINNGGCPSSRYCHFGRYGVECRCKKGTKNCDDPCRVCEQACIRRLDIVECICYPGYTNLFQGRVCIDQSVSSRFRQRDYEERKSMLRSDLAKWRYNRRRDLPFWF